MVTKIASGYFIWDPIIWALIFCVSVLIIGWAVLFISKRAGIQYISEVPQCNDSEDDWKIVHDMDVLRERCVEPWLKSQYKHLLIPLLFFIVILAIVFLH